VVRHEESTTPGTAVCYPAADLHPHRTAVVGTVDAEAACAEQWRLGHLGDGPVPRFATCILPTRTIALIPATSDTTCEDLGLARPAVGGDSHSIARMGDAVTKRLFDECLGGSASAAAAREELHKFGLDNWNVEITTERAFSPSEPCGSVFIDVPDKTLVVIPINDPHGPPPTTTP
jgi:hypothetical protein